MKTIVHVNQHHIKYNKTNSKYGWATKPVLTVKTYKDNRKGNTARVISGGREIGRFVYSPDKPLKCGAHVWFETEGDTYVAVE
jgi:hypothetical protein